jgi:hypothetical protein
MKPLNLRWYLISLLLVGPLTFVCCVMENTGQSLGLHHWMTSDVSGLLPACGCRSGNWVVALRPGLNQNAGLAR